MFSSSRPFNISRRRDRRRALHLFEGLFLSHRGTKLSLSFIKRLNTLLGARHAEATNPERRAAIRAELAERANDGRPTQPATRVFEDLRAHHQSQVKADTHGA